MGERAGLVEHQIGGARQRFQGVAARGQQAQTGEPAGGGGQRSGGCQPERAGAGDDEDRHHDPQRFRRIDEVPGEADRHGDQQQQADEPGGGAVRQPADARLFALRAVEQAHDGRQPRVGTEPVHPHHQRTRLIEAAADHA